jgi:hypothetical protein
MFKLQNLSGFDISSIEKVLSEEKQPFEVYLPKSTQQFFSANEAIADDYLLLAFSA